MKRSALPVLVLAAALLVIAGCGGGGGQETLSKDEYAKMVAATGDSLTQAFQGVVDEVGKLNPGNIDSVDDLNELMSQLGDVVGGGVDSLNQAADDLAAVSPPEDAQAANDELIDGLRLLAGDFETFEQAIRDGEFSKIEDLGSGFENIANSEAGKMIQEAIDELKSKGYDVAGNG
jgi:hypothetical protein